MHKAILDVCEVLFGCTWYGSKRNKNFEYIYIYIIRKDLKRLLNIGAKIIIYWNIPPKWDVQIPEKRPYSIIKLCSRILEALKWKWRPLRTSKTVKCKYVYSPQDLWPCLMKRKEWQWCIDNMLMITRKEQKEKCMWEIKYTFTLP